MDRTLASMPGPRGLPFIGSMHQVRLERMHLILEEWARRHGPIYRVRFGPRRLVVVSDPEATLYMHRERPHAFRRHVAVEPVFREVGLHGLFSVEGDEWRKQRPIVMRSLDPGHLKRFFPVISVAVERLHRRWSRSAQEGAFVPLRDELTRYTTDVICSLAFGADVSTLEREDADPLQRHIDRVFVGVNRRVNLPWPLWRWFRTRADRELEASLAVVHRAVHGFIEQARTSMDQRPELFDAPQNLLQALLAANRSAQLDDRDLAGNVMTMLLAGEDTTSSAISWALKLLADHPRERERAREEARAALPDGPVPREFAQLREVPYIDGVINEALRLVPPAPLTILTANEPVTLLGYQLPAGSLICALLRLPVAEGPLFSESSEFRPQRWLDGEDAAGRRAFMPFGGGARFCPGRYLAMVEARAALAMALVAFDFETDGARVEEFFGFTMHPHGLRMRFSHSAHA